jgi:hypothetical protein
VLIITKTITRRAALQAFELLRAMVLLGDIDAI